LARDTEADESFLYELFIATRSAELAGMPIDAAGKGFLLRMQYRSKNATYRRTYPTARWEVVELAGDPVGLLVTDVGARFVTFVDIELAPRAQGRGLATRLMMQALEECRRVGLPARVNVLEQNAASLRLVDRLGFLRIEECPPFVLFEWKP
jgi:GNAT superfamily N-acetyltransferase